MVIFKRYLLFFKPFINGHNVYYNAVFG